MDTASKGLAVQTLFNLGLWPKALPPPPATPGPVVPAAGREADFMADLVSALVVQRTPPKAPAVYPSGLSTFPLLTIHEGRCVVFTPELVHARFSPAAPKPSRGLGRSSPISPPLFPFLQVPVREEGAGSPPEAVGSCSLPAQWGVDGASSL